MCSEKASNECFYEIEHLENIPEKRETVEKEFFKLIPMNNQTRNRLKIETRITGFLFHNC